MNKEKMIKQILDIIRGAYLPESGLYKMVAKDMQKMSLKNLSNLYCMVLSING